MKICRAYVSAYFLAKSNNTYTVNTACKDVITVRLSNQGIGPVSSGLDNEKNQVLNYITHTNI
jgi:hypothetical protein